MVAVVGAPAKCQLREISGSNHESALLVSDIHEYLCSLPRLTVLISDVMHALVLSNIGKMLSHRCSYAYLSAVTAEQSHELCGVVLRPVCRSKSRHGDSHDSCGWKSRILHRLCRNQQSQCGIKST